MGLFRTYIESVSPLDTLVQSFKDQYPGLILYVDQHPNKIYLAEIKVPPGMRDQGIGTKIMLALQKYAQSVNLPLVLSPSPEKGQKARLIRFYKGLGFKQNAGRYKDYSLSSPFAATWIWRPQ